MTEKEAGMRRWICEMYNTRGLGFADESWLKFAAFCEANRLTDDVPMGRRLDGLDKWDIYEEQILAAANRPDKPTPNGQN